MREFLIFRDVFLGKSLFRAADADLFAVLRGGTEDPYFDCFRAQQ